MWHAHNVMLQHPTAMKCLLPWQHTAMWCNTNQAHDSPTQLAGNTTAAIPYHQGQSGMEHSSWLVQKFWVYVKLFYWFLRLRNVLKCTTTVGAHHTMSYTVVLQRRLTIQHFVTPCYTMQHFVTPCYTMLHHVDMLSLCIVIRLIFSLRNTVKT